MEAVYKSGGASRKAAAETSLVLDRPSIVSLKVAPVSMLKFERRGDDLVPVLRDGQEVAVRRGTKAAAHRARHRMGLPLHVADARNPPTTSCASTRSCPTTTGPCAATCGAVGNAWTSCRNELREGALPVAESCDRLKAASVRAARYKACGAPARPSCTATPRMIRPS